MSNNFEPLNDTELRDIKIYFKKLKELQGKGEQELGDDVLRSLRNLYGLIDKFGSGDPVKAAIAHSKALKWEAMPIT
ncbi:MAG: hypothetical protein JXR11_02605 [Balneola sp.]